MTFLAVLEDLQSMEKVVLNEGWIIFLCSGRKQHETGQALHKNEKWPRVSRRLNQEK
jgi:hypothetical protein